jgi:hypothetical protein
MTNELEGIYYKLKNGMIVRVIKRTESIIYVKVFDENKRKWSRGKIGVFKSQFKNAINVSEEEIMNLLM